MKYLKLLAFALVSTLIAIFVSINQVNAGSLNHRACDVVIIEPNTLGSRAMVAYVGLRSRFICFADSTGVEVSLVILITRNGDRLTEVSYRLGDGDIVFKGYRVTPDRLDMELSEKPSREEIKILDSKITQRLKKLFKPS